MKYSTNMDWSLKNNKTPKSTSDLGEILFDNLGESINRELFFNPVNPLKISLKEVGIDEKQLKLILKRIKKAKENKEYVVIFGDYDADGVCATAILWQVLFEIGCDVKPFIPHRTKHGYGVSIKAIDSIIEDRKPDLVITVDNGIVALEPIDYLKGMNVDVIITDHHQPEEMKGKVIFPNADYILHSNKLCGATVSWMLSREIEKFFKLDGKPAENSMDLCGIATIADQVKLFGANRSFAKFGIDAIINSKRIGLRLLIQQTIKDPMSIDSDTVGYAIAPRINAMGRMSEGIVALRFLCTKNKIQATTLLKELIETNDERKIITYNHLKSADKQIKLIENEHILIVHSTDFNEGILGLIAGAMLEKYNKPSIAISVGENFAKASVRSVPGVNIVEILREIRDDLIEVGGHPMAAGFGFDPKKLEQIKSRLFEICRNKISPDKLVKKIESECILPFNLVVEDTVDLIESFKPFGQGNRRPLFEFRDLQVLEISSMGKENAHLRIKLGNTDDDSVKCIGWRFGSLVQKFSIGDRVSAVGSLEFNVWNGRKTLQMILTDIK